MAKEDIEHPWPTANAMVHSAQHLAQFNEGHGCGSGNDGDNDDDSRPSAGKQDRPWLVSGLLTNASIFLLF